MGRDLLNAVIIGEYAVALALVVVGAFVVARRHGPGPANALVVLDLVVICGSAILFPVYVARHASVPAAAVFACAVLAVMGLVSLAALAGAAESVLRTLGASARRQNGAILAASLVLTVGGLEVLAQLTTRLGLVPYYVPLETRVGRQTEDWRTAHIADDDLREPDPVLFWRPVPRYPYNAQRFKGPELAVPKPTGTVRIMCYGDSNTDGPNLGRSWPARLQGLLDAGARGSGRRYEVVNAGVFGYSSYQGLMRFREEVGTYRPDVVLVSFGWNDAANAIGTPDHEFARSGIPDGVARRRTLARGVLFNSRLYRQEVDLLPWRATPAVRLRRGGYPGPGRPSRTGRALRTCPLASHRGYRTRHRAHQDVVPARRPPDLLRRARLRQTAFHPATIGGAGPRGR